MQGKNRWDLLPAVQLKQSRNHGECPMHDLVGVRVQRQLQGPPREHERLLVSSPDVHDRDGSAPDRVPLLQPGAELLHERKLLDRQLQAI